MAWPRECAGDPPDEAIAPRAMARKWACMASGDGMPGELCGGMMGEPGAMGTLNGWNPADDGGPCIAHCCWTERAAAAKCWKAWLWWASCDPAAARGAPLLAGWGATPPMVAATSGELGTGGPCGRRGGVQAAAGAGGAGGREPCCSGLGGAGCEGADETERPTPAKLSPRLLADSATEALRAGARGSGSAAGEVLAPRRGDAPGEADAGRRRGEADALASVGRHALGNSICTTASVDCARRQAHRNHRGALVGQADRDLADARHCQLGRRDGQRRAPRVPLGGKLASAIARSPVAGSARAPTHPERDANGHAQVR